MQIPLQITTRDLQLSESDERMIRQAAGKLEAFWGRITSCRVLVEVPHRRRRTGLLYNVRIDLGVPGGELAITRRPRTTLATAVQEDGIHPWRQRRDAALEGVPRRRLADAHGLPRLDSRRAQGVGDLEVLVAVELHDPQGKASGDRQDLGGT